MTPIETWFLGSILFSRDTGAHSTRLAAAAAAVFFVGVAWLPQAEAVEPDSDGEVLEQIVVTGSRVPRTDLISNSPVGIIDAGELRRSGVAEIERALESLPQMVGTVGGTSNLVTGSGIATVELRGLGPARTLVLVNGRRVVSSGTDGVVDLNGIPTSLVERIEVVTGGASAVYGSDAMAGVVNFILKDELDGVDFGGQWSQSTRGDSARANFDVTGGRNLLDSRGRVTFHASYTDRDATLANERPWGEASLVNATDAGGAPVLRRLLNDDVRAAQTRFSAPALTGRRDPFGTAIGALGIVLTDGGWRARVAADELGVAFDNTMQLPMTRAQATALGSLQINERLRGFAELGYSRSKVLSVLSPVPLPSSLIAGFRVDLANPFMPADLRQFLATALDPAGSLGGRVPLTVTRGMRELGNRTSEDEREVSRAVIGLDGTLSGDMTWEMFANIGRHDLRNVQDGGIHLGRYQQSWLVDSRDPTLCANPTGGCRVANVFRTGGIGAATADFWSADLVNEGKIEQLQVGANLAGNLLEMPAGPLGFAIGAEYRDEDAEFVPDLLYQTNQAVSRVAGLKPLGGGYDVYEVYGEVVVPILADLPLVRSLTLESGYRYSNYSTVGQVSSFKIGGTLAPFADLRIRGLVQRAVRAPNINELYRAGDVTAPTARDFCEVAARPTQAERDFCLQLGVPAAAIATFQQENQTIRTVIGGNPNLGEESSDTWSAGFVYRPSQIPELSVTADYYSIDITDAIAIFGGGLAPTISACRQNPTLQNPFCAPLTARRTDGQLDLVPLLNQNIAALQTTGIDFSVAYQTSLPGNWGTLAWSLAGTHVRHNEFQSSPAVAAIDCAGFVGGGSCTNADPEWRGVQRLSWKRNALEVSLRHRYIGSVQNGRIAAAIAAGTAAPAVPVARLDPVEYFDLHAFWSIGERLTVSGGIDNLFDEAPPIIGNTDGRGLVNTDTQTYDVIGRQVSFGLRWRL